MILPLIALVVGLLLVVRGQEPRSEGYLVFGLLVSVSAAGALLKGLAYHAGRGAVARPRPPVEVAAPTEEVAPPYAARPGARTAAGEGVLGFRQVNTFRRKGDDAQARHDAA